MSCLSPHCWYFREHLVRPLGPALSQLDAGSADAGAARVVSVVHGSAPSRNSGAAAGGANPAMSLICVTDCLCVNSTAAKLADGTQIRVGANRGGRLRLQTIQRDGSNGNITDKKRNSSVANIESYQEEGNVLAITSHWAQLSKGQDCEKTPKCHQAIPSEHVATKASGPDGLLLMDFNLCNVAGIPNWKLTWID